MQAHSKIAVSIIDGKFEKLPTDDLGIVTAHGAHGHSVAKQAPRRPVIDDVSPRAKLPADSERIASRARLAGVRAVLASMSEERRSCSCCTCSRPRPTRIGALLGIGNPRRSRGSCERAEFLDIGREADR
jgi:hypothetical protein